MSPMALFGNPPMRERCWCTLYELIQSSPCQTDCLPILSIMLIGGLPVAMVSRLRRLPACPAVLRDLWEA